MTQTAIVHNPPETSVVESHQETKPQILAEMQAIAMSAKEKAVVEARTLLAYKKPRDIDVVRLGILADMRRPFFAQASWFRRPVGKEYNKETGQWEEKFAEGPSIRFMESALRHMTNILAESHTIYDDQNKQIIVATVMDLEANVTYQLEILAEKKVERSNGKGRQVLAVRKNTYDKDVFVVVATEDEFNVKKASLVSKAIRTLAGRIVPADLVEEAHEVMLQTLAKRDAEDPEAARKRLVDAFASIGVSPADLKTYLGHDLAQCSPPQMQGLRSIYQAIRDGETTWASVLSPADTEPEKSEAKTLKDKIKTPQAE